jgi:thiol-disulfide isomerase/thioredoxin/uncharacterized membrane protein YphA (DoxX/SURF4 family)
METVLLLARLVLALIFGVAGIAKAADRAGSRRAIAGFGVPEALAAPSAIVLPVIEVAIAIALISTRFAWLGAIAATALLLVFAAAMATSLARGKTPDCHCFGQIHSAPVSGSTLTRTLLLTAVAGLIVSQARTNPGPSAVHWVSESKTAEIVSLALSLSAVALMATGALYLRRLIAQQATLLAKVEALKKVVDEDYAEPPVERAGATGPTPGLPVGAPAPGFALASIDGARITRDDLLASRNPLLLVFVSPNCAPCKSLLPSIAEWDRQHRSRLTVALLARGDAEENRERMGHHRVRNLLLQGDSDVAEDYGAKWTPAAVIVRDGRIASPITFGDEAIRNLAASAVGAGEQKTIGDNGASGNGHVPQITIGSPHSLVNLGKPAPSFTAEDLRGETVRTRDLRGLDTMLLFWDPKCPYCRAMANDVREWEDNPPEGAPRLIFVASGDRPGVDAESERFNSRFLYDPDSQIALLFGTNLTPSAVLIDANGRMASGPEGGRANILALAGVRVSAEPAA